MHSGLLAEISAACDAAGISKAEFGKLALKDPRLVYDMEKGRELRRSTEERVVEALRGIQIEGAA